MEIGEKIVSGGVGYCKRRLASGRIVESLMSKSPNGDEREISSALTNLSSTNLPARSVIVAWIYSVAISKQVSREQSKILLLIRSPAANSESSNISSIHSPMEI